MEYNNNMIFEDDRHFYWPDAEASSPAAAGFCGGSIKMHITWKNRANTIIITYPPNLGNIFIISLQLGYSDPCAPRKVYALAA